MTTQHVDAIFCVVVFRALLCSFELITETTRWLQKSSGLETQRKRWFQWGCALSKKLLTSMQHIGLINSFTCFFSKQTLDCFQSLITLRSSHLLVVFVFSLFTLPDMRKNHLLPLNRHWGSCPLVCFYSRHCCRFFAYSF